LVTIEENCLHHYYLKTRIQLIEWRISAHATANNSEESAGKILASMFWYQGGNVLIDYLPKAQNINAEYFPSLLVQLKDILKEKLRRNFTKRVLFLHDNASAHRPLATQKDLA
jgi:hypothetical protein